MGAHECMRCGKYLLRGRWECRHPDCLSKSGFSKPCPFSLCNDCYIRERERPKEQQHGGGCIMEDSGGEPKSKEEEMKKDRGEDQVVIDVNVEAKKKIKEEKMEKEKKLKKEEEEKKVKSDNSSSSTTTNVSKDGKNTVTIKKENPSEDVKMTDATSAAVVSNSNSLSNNVKAVNMKLETKKRQRDEVEIITKTEAVAPPADKKVKTEQGAIEKTAVPEQVVK